MLVYLIENLALTPSYTSTVTFSVTSRNTSIASTGTIAATGTVSAQFGELLSSDLVRNAAAKRMGLEEYPANIAVYVPEDTNILIMDVTAATPELAYKSAISIMDSHGEFSQNVFSSAVLDNINGPTISATMDNAASRASILKLSAPAGAAFMIFLLVVMCIRADTIQTPSGAKLQVDGKLLATVYHERKHRTLQSYLKKQKTSLLISNPTCSFYYTETIHQLRIYIERAHEKDNKQVFVITSCVENEGKSTIAANIALSLAQKHQRVLLLDADLRKPAQQLIFEANIEPGKDFGSIMTKGYTEASLMDSIVRLKFSDLSILFAVELRRRNVESLSADSFRPILEVLRKHFSYIIIDTPPLGFFADAEVITDAADSSILVVRQDLASAVAINDAIDALTDTHAEFLGFVLNNVRSFRTINMHGIGYGNGYGYGYGYGYGGKRQKSGSQPLAKEVERR